MTIKDTLLILAALTLPLSACSKGPADPYDTDSQSHWLQACVDDSDCGGVYSCRCNVCVRTCGGATDTCSDTLTATICAAADAPAAQALCANSLDVDVCLPACTDCPGGWICAGDACVPEERRTLDIGLDADSTSDAGADADTQDTGTTPDASTDADQSTDACATLDDCEAGHSLRRIPGEGSCDQYLCVEDLPFDCPGVDGCDSIDDVCLTTTAGPPPEDGGSGESTSCEPLPAACASDKSCACVQAEFPGSDCRLDNGAFHVSQALP